MASITVRGDASVPGRPDEVVVTLQLSAVRAAPDEAYSDVAARSEQLDALLEELGVPADARSTTGVTLQEHLEYDERGRAEQRGYRASNGLSIRLSDHSALARLLREAATGTQAQIAGPYWVIAADNPARLEACRRAAETARRKAEAYAGALGLRLGALVAAIEPGTSPPDRAAKRMVAAFAPMMEEPQIRVDPGQLDVHGAVEVTYALEDA